MKTETIKAIFMNLLFVIGVILTIIGFVRGSLTVTRMFVFEKYPLQSYEETRCDLEYMPMATQVTPAVTPEGKGEATLIPEEELQSRREKCLASVERERETRKVEDFVTSLTILVSGVFLVLSFKRFIFK